MAQSDLERLDELLAEQELSIRRAFREYIQAVGTDGPVFAAILDRLQRGDVEGALQLVDSYVTVLGNVLPAISHVVGAAAATELAQLVPNVAVGISFDPTYPRAAEIIRENRLRFVTDFTADQRAATLQALDRAYQTGQGTQGAARAFQDSIGLTPSEEAAVDSYRRVLEANSTQALDRALRDRRFDDAVRAAIEKDKPLSPGQIDKMVARYRANSLVNRSQRIARTEGVRATSQARLESLDQMIEQTKIDVERVDRIWRSTHDTRVRHWHAVMDGQIRGRNEPFDDGLGNQLMYPGDPSAPAATVINCRCVFTFSIRPPA